MTEYFLMDETFSKGDIYFTDVEFPKIIERNIFQGKSLAKKSVTIITTLKNKKDIPTDFPSRASKLTIVSSELKTLLEKHEDSSNLEFLPVNVKNGEGLKKEYWGLNILNNIKCFDWKNSKYDPMPDSMSDASDRPWKIYDLKIKKEAVGDRHIFRMYEEPVEIFVSKKLKEEIEKKRLTGMRFRTVVDYVEDSW